MKRILVVVATIMVLGFAGLAIAQTAGGDTAQPGTATNPQALPSDTQPATPPAGDPATAGAPAAQAAPSAAAEPAPQPAAQAQSKDLPATAGYNPLMLTIGALALVAFATLLVRATRRVSHS